MLYTDEAIKKRKHRITIIKNVLIVLAYIIFVPLLIYNISLIAQSIIVPDKTPNFLGIKTYVIISGSMKPNLEIGDIVITKEVEQEKLQVGDIISFRQGQSVVTHRISQKVMENGEVQYKTKGDNNNAEDSNLVSYKLIEGKVINKIPVLGKIVLLLKGKVAIVMIVIIFYIYLVRTEKINNKKEKRKIKRMEYEKQKEEVI